MYLLLKVSELKGKENFMGSVATKDDLLRVIFHTAQTELNKSVHFDDRGRAFFGKSRNQDDKQIGMNYVRLCYEMILQWGKDYGVSNPKSDVHIYYFLAESLKKKGKVPLTFYFQQKNLDLVYNLGYWEYKVRPPPIIEPVSPEVKSNQNETFSPEGTASSELDKQSLQLELESIDEDCVKDVYINVRKREDFDQQPRQTFGKPVSFLDSLRKDLGSSFQVETKEKEQRNEIEKVVEKKVHIKLDDSMNNSTDFDRNEVKRIKNERLETNKREIEIENRPSYEEKSLQVSQQIEEPVKIGPRKMEIVINNENSSKQSFDQKPSKSSKSLQIDLMEIERSIMRSSYLQRFSSSSLTYLNRTPSNGADYKDYSFTTQHYKSKDRLSIFSNKESPGSNVLLNKTASIRSRVDNFFYEEPERMITEDDEEESVRNSKESKYLNIIARISNNTKKREGESAQRKSSEIPNITINSRKEDLVLKNKKRYDPFTKHPLSVSEYVSVGK